VVIDIFRASSSICYGIHNGAEAIIPVLTVEECIKYNSNGFLLAAERNGAVVEGFAIGNSPFSYTEDKVRGKTIVLTTTNGTRSIQLSKRQRAKKRSEERRVGKECRSEWTRCRRRNNIYKQDER